MITINYTSTTDIIPVTVEKYWVNGEEITEELFTMIRDAYSKGVTTESYSGKTIVNHYKHIDDSEPADFSGASFDEWGGR